LKKKAQGFRIKDQDTIEKVDKEEMTHRRF